MIKTGLVIAAIAVAMVMGSAAIAADWNGLTINAPQYSLSITDHGSGSGTIKQFSGGTNIAITQTVLYCLPQITVQQAINKTFWGVCIDTHELSTSPEGAILKQGWAPTHTAPGTAGRLNGTVLNQTAWGHTTYLFSQFAATINQMTDVQRAAFQLATWEVMSGDGSISGGNWANGAGNFTATNVSGTHAGTLLWEANNYVKAAYVGFADHWSTDLANQAYYFSGVKNNCFYQDYLVCAPAPTTNRHAVPEIPAVVLGPLGLMAFGMLKRKFAK